MTTRLDYMSCRVTLCAAEPVELPAYTGSTLRGALGGVLKAVGCQLDAKRACESACAMPQRCAYGALMETPVPKGAPKRIRASKYAPHPWVITPPEGGALFSGDELELELTLFGPARRRLAEVVEALGHLEEIGLGKGRGALELVRIEDASSGEPIWRGGELMLRGVTPESLALEPQTGDEDVEALAVDLVTPTQLLRGGDLVRELDVGELVYQCANRLHLMAACHGRTGPEPIRAGAWSKRARSSDVTIVEHDLAPVRLERWSSRQGRHHDLRGLVGRVVLSGPLGPFLPVLRAGQVTHIGKGISFGLGKLRLGEP